MFQCPPEGDGETESGGRERWRTPVHGAAGDGHAQDLRPRVQQDQSCGGQQGPAVSPVPGLCSLLCCTHVCCNALVIAQP